MTPGKPRTTHDGEAVPPDTAARRQAILADLHRVMDARRRGRRLLAGSAALLCLLGLGAAGWSGWIARPTGHAPRPGQAPDDTFAVADAPAPRTGVQIQIIPTDATALARLRVPTDGRVRISTISDDELVALASATGQGQGLMRVGETAVLITEDSRRDASPAPGDREEPALPIGQ